MKNLWILNRQCHEIFYLCFFIKRLLPVPLEVLIVGFIFWAYFHKVIERNVTQWCNHTLLRWKKHGVSYNWIATPWCTIHCWVATPWSIIHRWVVTLWCIIHRWVATPWSIITPELQHRGPSYTAELQHCGVSYTAELQHCGVSYTAELQHCGVSYTAELQCIRIFIIKIRSMYKSEMELNDQISSKNAHATVPLQYTYVSPPLYPLHYGISAVTG